MKHFVIKYRSADSFEWFSRWVHSNEFESARKVYNQTIMETDYHEIKLVSIDGNTERELEVLRYHLKKN